jgi:hypothetical protein
LLQGSRPSSVWSHCHCWMFFPTIIRPAPWGQGQRWSSKRWLSHHSTILPGW